MTLQTRARMVVLAATLVVATTWAGAQTHGEPEEFSAVALANDEFGAGAGRLLIRVTRWATDAERDRLVATLQSKGQRAMLEELSDARSAGTIRTPGELAYDLRYAHETRGEDGSRQIVILTDRPIEIWEHWSGSRTLQYPFSVIQMQFGPEGKGKGTLTVATRIRAYGKFIEMENFSTAPILLREIESNRRGED